MKKIIYTLVLFFMAISTVSAKDDVTVEITNVGNASLKKTMEKNASMLLTAINKAESRGLKSVNFSVIGIQKDAKDVINMLWNSYHMRVVDNDIVEKCITLGSSKCVRGYEIMNIAIEMKPFGNNVNNNVNQEIAITFNPQGDISDFVISSGFRQFSTLMQAAHGEDDLDRRMQMLHYAEKLRTAYFQKDITFVENLLSVSQYRANEEYLSRLKDIFSRNKYINVKFTDVFIERHGARPYIYGLTCFLDWQTKHTDGRNAEDLGVFFMLWDFSDENNPQIHLCPWRATDDKKVFHIKSFDI